MASNGKKAVADDQDLDVDAEAGKKGRASDLVIGQRLRALREEHRLTMRGLAKLASVSASLISDVERGRVEPSISVLKRIAAALDTTLMYFFSESGLRDDRVVREGERRRLGGRELDSLAGAREDGVCFELASPDSTSTIEAIYGSYEVGASLGDEPVSHDGEEWGMVLKGRLKVWVGDDVYFLGPGDSIAFESTIPHRMANAADEITEYIWIDTPKTF